MAENVRETQLGLLIGGDAASADSSDLAAIMANAARRRRSKYVDLSGQAKLWFMTGVKGAGKTMIARWLFWHAIARGRHAALAALGPKEESLTSWFAGVERPPSNGPAEMARWLREYLDYLMSNPRWRERSAIFDLDCEADETALERVINVTPDLPRTLENAGFGVVACHVLTPRKIDLSVVRTLEYAGFQPEATVAAAQ